jgi:hypothetical protein
MALAILRQAMKNASTPDDPAKVITLPPASLDNLADQVKHAEQRKKDAEVRQGKETSSMTWQHQMEAKSLASRHEKELADLDAEHKRAKEMFLTALAARKLAIEE